MSWEKLGIQDPGIKWRGNYQDWRTNKLGVLFELTLEELEDLRSEIDAVKELGLWSAQLDGFDDWLEYTGTLLEESVEDFDFRTKLVDVRIELSKLRKQFDNFAVGIDYWLGD